MIHIEEYRIKEISPSSKAGLQIDPIISHQLIGYCTVEGRLAPCSSANLVYGELNSKIKKLKGDGWEEIAPMRFRRK